MIKYKFAENEEKKVICIDEISNETRVNTEFTCLSCAEILIPKLGSIRQKHFAHKTSTKQRLCSWETYLHSLAKRYLYDNLLFRAKNNLPFLIEYDKITICDKCNFPESSKSDCILTNEKSTFNLLKTYNNIYLEKNVENFRPDISLFNESSEEFIFIEIAVNHKIEEIKRNSKYKIIEIEISEEAQINLLKNPVINKGKLPVKLFNFDFKTQRRKINYSNCKEGNVNKFIVFNSGKSLNFFDKSFGDYYKIKNLIIYEKNITEDDIASFDFVDNIEEAFKKNVNIKNCHLCRYHGYEKGKFGRITQNIFCKYYRKNIDNSNDAAECKIYRIDEKSFYNNF
jgi:hypothetical protein